MQNVSVNPDLSQTATALLNPHQGKAPHGSQSLIVFGVDDSGQVRSFGFVGKSQSLPSRLASNVGYPRMLNHTKSQSELLGTNSGLRVKTEGVSEFSLNSKNSSNMKSKQFSSDDYMSIFLR
ncbi:hypothetical protein SUGI_0396520 [Cryptomeria japonica]|nr:hypothetical protein SUGI_0396520 [Cryptomeria japonica]